MPNSLSFTEGSPAAAFYASLGAEERASLDAALEYVRDVPFPHGDIITKRIMAPHLVYVFDDNEWQIAYTMRFLAGESSYDISVHAIARL